MLAPSITQAEILRSASSGAPESGAFRRAVQPIVTETLVDGRYQILGPLKSGGMDHVWRARDLSLQRSVALKVLAAPADPSSLARFFREARTLVRVRHDNVVQLYGFGPSRGSYFIAMELVAGQPLDELIEEHAQKKAVLDLKRAAAVPARWGRVLDVLDHRPRAMNHVQDLVVLRKPVAAPINPPAGRETASPAPARP